jgi:hypothetical protein
MRQMLTPQQAADKWAAGTLAAGRRYMAEMTPQERLDAARTAYVRGHMEHADFERSAESAIRDGA